MRLLLVNPNREHAPEPVPPVGLCLAAEAAAAAGHEVRVLDLSFAVGPERALRRALRRERPAAVGMTVRNLDNADAHAPRFYLDELRAYAGVIRAETGAPPLLGGAGLTADPERTMVHLGAELAVLGPAERAFPALLHWLASDRTGVAPPGVAVRSGGAWSAAAADPDRAPPFASARLDRWIDLRPYLRRGGAVPVQTRRGCPMACVYCNYPAIEGRRVVLRSPEEVASDVVAAAAAGARWVELCDAVFNLPAQHALQVCAAISARNPGVFLRSSITPAGLDAGVVGAMKKAGFSAALCSPDAAHPDTLAAYHKGFGRADLDRAVSLLRDAAIPTLFCFILGGPGETSVTLRETLRYASEEITAPHAALLATRMRLYPRTPLWSAVTAQGAGETTPTAVPPQRPTPEAFYLAPGLVPQEVDEAAAEVARRYGHVQYMDSGRGPLAAIVRRALAFVDAGLPAFSVPALLGRRRATPRQPQSTS